MRKTKEFTAWEKRTELSGNVLDLIDNDETSWATYRKVADKLEELEQTVTNFEYYSDEIKSRVKLLQEDSDNEDELYLLEEAVEELIEGLHPGTLKRFDYHIPSKVLLAWLQETFVEPAKKDVLDNTEKNYLKNFLRPFINMGCYITITKAPNEFGFYELEVYIDHANDYATTVTLPPFSQSEEDMYIGMVPNKEYSLEDLKLC